MKKRKTPIALVTVLIIAVTLALLWNMPRQDNGNGPKVQDSELTGQSNELPVKSELLKTRDEEAHFKSKNPDQPLIEVPKQAHGKQKPSDTDVSGQWYTSESSKNGK